MITQKPTVLDLFCGAGGLSLGFEKAGFTILKACDNWKPATDTYRLNFTHPIAESAITPFTDFPSADVIIGGPPCQGFSSAGMRRKADERNSLISVFAKIITQLRPVAFVFENVEGFLTSENGKYVFELLQPLIQAGYRIHLRKINASNFGVPQHRKRVIAIGGLGWDPTFPEITHSTFGAPGSTVMNRIQLPFTPTLGQAFDGLPPAQAIGDVEYPNLTEHSYRPYNETDAKRAALLGPNGKMRDLPEELWHESFKQRANRRVRDGMPTARRGGAPSGLRRLALGEPSKAITGGALGDFIHPRENRPLTIRECARLQTFPDEFVFSGTQAQKIQLIGNAVPPKLALAVGNTLIADLKKDPSQSSEGKLLSFVPTSSTGMSPKLQHISKEIKMRFMDEIQYDQKSLWL